MSRNESSKFFTGRRVPRLEARRTQARVLPRRRFLEETAGRKARRQLKENYAAGFFAFLALAATFVRLLYRSRRCRFSTLLDCWPIVALL